MHLECNLMDFQLRPNKFELMQSQFITTAVDFEVLVSWKSPTVATHFIFPIHLSHSTKLKCVHPSSSLHQKEMIHWRRMICSTDQRNQAIIRLQNQGADIENLSLLFPFTFCKFFLIGDRTYLTEENILSFEKKIHFP